MRPPGARRLARRDSVRAPSGKWWKAFTVRMTAHRRGGRAVRDTAERSPRTFRTPTARARFSSSTIIRGSTSTP
jgi:hypothetical protein